MFVLLTAGYSMSELCFDLSSQEPCAFEFSKKLHPYIISLKGQSPVLYVESHAGQGALGVLSISWLIIRIISPL